jgi:hypothetical protein
MDALNTEHKNLGADMQSKQALLERLETAEKKQREYEQNIREKESELEKVQTERERYEADLNSKRPAGAPLNDGQTAAIEKYKATVLALPSQLAGLRQKLKDNETAVKESRLKDQSIMKLREEINSMKKQRVRDHERAVRQGRGTAPLLVCLLVVHD